METKVDINFDFTLDSPGYWDNFWENKGGMGGGSCDPDAVCHTLQKYHQILWSKTLPCGKEMVLTPDSYKLGKNSNNLFLRWENFSFSSDFILPSFRYHRLKNLINELKETFDYCGYIEDFLHKAYTIGGFMIWPLRGQSINQTRGCNARICDRMDRTLECIRRYYIGQESPMSKCLEKDKEFFDLFVDFKGFVDFFFLHDMVSDDYNSIIFGLGDADLKKPALPKTKEEYFHWMDYQMDFLNARNQRIKNS